MFYFFSNSSLFEKIVCALNNKVFKVPCFYVSGVKDSKCSSNHYEFVYGIV